MVQEIVIWFVIDKFLEYVWNEVKEKYGLEIKRSFNEILVKTKNLNRYLWERLKKLKIRCELEIKKSFNKMLKRTKKFLRRLVRYKE